jgi:hypothetical protein
MADSGNKRNDTNRSSSRAKADALRARLLEELEEFRGNCEYIHQTCEIGLKNHPGDIKEWMAIFQEINTHCSTVVFGAHCFRRATESRTFEDEVAPGTTFRATRLR